MSDPRLVVITPSKRKASFTGGDEVVANFRRVGLFGRHTEPERPSTIVCELFPDGCVVGTGGSQTSLRDLIKTQPRMFSGFPGWFRAMGESGNAPFSISLMDKSGAPREAQHFVPALDITLSDLTRARITREWSGHCYELEDLDVPARSFLYCIHGDATFLHRGSRHEIHGGRLVELTARPLSELSMEGRAGLCHIKIIDENVQQASAGIGIEVSTVPVQTRCCDFIFVRPAPHESMLLTKIDGNRLQHGGLLVAAGDSLDFCLEGESRWQTVAQNKACLLSPRTTCQIALTEAMSLGAAGVFGFKAIG